MPKASAKGVKVESPMYSQHLFVLLTTKLILTNITLLTLGQLG